MRVVHTIKSLMTQHRGNQSQVARILKLNRSTVAKHYPTEGVVVLDDGRIFKDTGKVYDGIY